MGGIFKSLEDAVKGIALAALLGASMPASEAPAFTQQQKQEQEKKQEPKKLQAAPKDNEPDEATQRFREDQIRTSAKFAEDYKKKDASKNLSEKIAIAGSLADKLAQGAENPNNDSALRFVYYREAIRASAEALDLPKAFGFAERLSESHNTSGLRFKSEAFNIARKLVKDADQVTSVAESAYELAGSIYIIGDFGSAIKVANDAKGLPKLSKEYAQKFTDLSSEIAQVRDAELAISINENDAKANDTIARYAAFRRGKMKEAKVHADKSKNQDLIDKIDGELSDPDTSESQFMLGKQYFDASKKLKGFEKDEYLMRSAYWLTAAIPRANELMKGDIEKMLKEMEPVGSVNSTLVDLIKLIDVKRDSIKGAWKIEGALVSPSEPYAKIIVPFSPSEEYELKVVVEPRGKVGGFYTGLVFGDKQFGVELDGSGGTRSRLYVIDGKAEGVQGADSKGAVLVSGKPNTIVYTVKRNNVTVNVNGKQVINWKADYSKVTPWADWKVPESKAFSFGAYETNCYIQQASLKILSGTGKKLR